MISAVAVAVAGAFVRHLVLPDIAIAALVIDAGYGAQAAGPEVKSFFDGY